MGARNGVGGGVPSLTAHERFKARSRLRFWLSLGMAGLVHLLLFLWSPPFRPGNSAGGVREHEMRAIRLVPASELQQTTIRRPAPPTPVGERERERRADRRELGRRVTGTGPIPASPRAPELALSDEVAELVEAASTLTLPSPQVVVPPLPTPAPAPAEAGLDRFRPVNALMEKPELVNRSQVRRALLREYPRELQRKGVEGNVLVWFWIDEKGKVQKYEIRGSSGHVALDAAAERVIPVMKFRPAKERGKAIPVVVTLPIRFEVE